MSGISQSDLEWIRGILDGRPPQEIARIKAVVAHACGAQPPGAATLLDIRDDLTEARAIVHALDLAFAGLENHDRHALRTIGEIALGRLDAICAQVDVLRGEGMTAG